MMMCSAAEACDLFVYPLTKHHTSPAPWSSPYREILNTKCASPRLPYTAQLNDLHFCTNSTATEAPFFPTPRASLDATRINEISHADGARAAAAPERDKNLCHGTGIHMGGTSETGEWDAACLCHKNLLNSEEMVKITCSFVTSFLSQSSVGNE